MVDCQLQCAIKVFLVQVRDGAYLWEAVYVVETAHSTHDVATHLIIKHSFKCACEVLVAVSLFCLFLMETWLPPTVLTRLIVRDEL